MLALSGPDFDSGQGKARHKVVVKGKSCRKRDKGEALFNLQKEVRRFDVDQ
jgi:hypothetical protein